MSSKPVGALEAASAAISTLAWPESATATGVDGHDGSSSDAGPSATAHSIADQIARSGVHRSLGAAA
jgi:hypothetical protein